MTKDVESALAFLTSPEIVERYSVDAGNIIVAGFSFGGNMAIIHSSQNPTIKRVIVIAGADMSEIARAIENDAYVRDYYIRMLDETTSNPDMARSEYDGKEMVLGLIEDKDRFDIVQAAERLAGKDILVIGGWKDQDATIEGHVLPFIRALQSHDAGNLAIEVFDDDHAFEVVREELAGTIISWIKKEAVPAQ